ncbi:hypothetical protein FPZ24_15970 [Sphingomonas panacisoli]|uniref:Uncharacterized protein n=1 Tax=Sphingomonas panacisoli TaxID=1813879 RepID=A0A5B8LLF5_9SPHN|nr:hypothetical protein FPZ24_15970 [Sphingomonas panacisoli]
MRVAVGLDDGQEMQREAFARADDVAEHQLVLRVRDHLVLIGRDALQLRAERTRRQGDGEQPGQQQTRGATDHHNPRH